MVKLIEKIINFTINMFKEYSQNQVQLLPQNINELISKNHVARLINQVINEMDLSSIEDTYSEKGQRAYHPKLLIKVLVYGYTIGVSSSRKIADKLKEDVVFMWLAGRQNPDFRTISDFRKDKLVEVKGLFIQVLELCSELGMIRIGKVNIDGTKMRADASGNKIQYRKLLESRRAKIAEQVQEILEQAEAIDAEEDEIYGDSTEHRIAGLDMKEVSKKLKQLKRKKESIKKKQKKLEAKKSDINKKLRKIRKDRNTMYAYPHCLDNDVDNFR